MWARLAALAIVYGVAGWPGAAVAAPTEEYTQCRDGGRQADVRIGQCTRAIQSGKLEDHELTEALRSRARLYDQSKQYDLSLADYKEAIRRAPDNVATYVARGNVYLLKLRRYEEAIDDFERALYLNPKNEYALSGRASAYIVQKQFGRALQDMNAAIEINPRQWFLFSQRGGIFRALEEFQKAKSDFDTAISMAPGQWSPYFSRALLHEKMGNLDLAGQDFSLAYTHGGSAEPILQAKLRLYGQPMFRGAAPATIELPLRVILVNGLTANKAGATMTNHVIEKDARSVLIDEINTIWRQAGIRWILKEVVTHRVSDPATAESLTVPLTETHRNMSDEELGQKRAGLRKLRTSVTDGKVHTVVILPFIGSDVLHITNQSQKIGYIGAWQDGDRDDKTPPRRAELTESRPYKDGSVARAMAAALAGQLGASKEKCDEHCLTGSIKSRGYHLSAAQITAARKAAGQELAARN